jgi:hypothetical protein
VCGHGKLEAVGRLVEWPRQSHQLHTAPAREAVSTVMMAVSTVMMVAARLRLDSNIPPAATRAALASDVGVGQGLGDRSGSRSPLPVLLRFIARRHWAAPPLTSPGVSS